MESKETVEYTPGAFASTIKDRSYYFILLESSLQLCFIETTICEGYLKVNGEICTYEHPEVPPFTVNYKGYHCWIYEADKRPLTLLQS